VQPRNHTISIATAYVYVGGTHPAPPGEAPVCTTGGGVSGDATVATAEYGGGVATAAGVWTGAGAWAAAGLGGGEYGATAGTGTVDPSRKKMPSSVGQTMGISQPFSLLKRARSACALIFVRFAASEELPTCIVE